MFKTRLSCHRTFVRLFATLTLLMGSAFAQQAKTVVIGQFYGAGGNNGATFKNDYVELFNQSSSPISLSGYSLQYASATGSSYSVVPLPSASIQPGGFYLVQLAGGTTGVALPVAPDATSASINMSGSTGKIALVNSTTALSGACPATDPTVLDYVGYGAVSCSEGGTPAPALTPTTMAFRKVVCVDSDNNGNDFAAVAQTPRNSSSPAQPCTGGIAFAAAGNSNPAAVFQGGTTLLTVTVSPATSPASTGITVTADLSAIGGSSNQQFFDNGTNGDATPNDNVFSYQPTISSGAATGAFNIAATAADAQSHTATVNIGLTILQQAQAYAIHTIQTNAPNSALLGQTVETSGIVTGVRSNGFFIQAKDTDTDNDPNTSEGIFVFTGSPVPSAAVVGNEVQVTAAVQIFPSGGAAPNTELSNPAVTVLSTGNALPSPIQLTAADDSPNGGFTQLLKYQSMRVAVPSLTTTSGTQGSLSEKTETYTSNGLFYAVISGVARPFREPGLSVTDTVPPTTATNIPRYDGNPEVLEIDSKGLGRTPFNLTSNTVLANVNAIADFSFGTAQLDVEPTSNFTVSGGVTVQAVPLPGSKEFTIASFNLERFYNDVTDTSGAVVVTTAAYQRRLAKASQAIRNVLGSPDIVGLDEVENISVVTDLATKISQDALAAVSLIRNICLSHSRATIQAPLRWHSWSSNRE